MTPASPAVDGRTPSRRQVLKAAAVLATSVFLGAIGWLLLEDQPGLRLEYFSNTPAWTGRPVHAAVGEPRLDGLDEVGLTLVSTDVFSLRWSGWIHVGEPGSYRFRLDADEAAYLRVGGETVVEVESGRKSREYSHRLRLARGMHPIEVGAAQTHGGHLIRLQWKKKNGQPQFLPPEDLFAGRPLAARRWLRRASSSMAPTYRRLAGAVLAIFSLLLLRAGLRLWPRWRHGLEQLRRQWGEFLSGIAPGLSPTGRRRLATGVFLVALFVAVWVLTARLVTPTLDGDDIRYLDAAFFSKKMGWILNRYVHVYLVKLSIWFQGGEPFLASRFYWPLMFAGTLTAMTVAVRSLGPRWQIRTLAIALFLLLAQPGLMGNLGAVFADFSAMWFVTAGVAVYLHARSRGGPAGFGWHAFAIGLLTFAAFKSKETGIVLLWLPVLFLWTGGRIDLRRFAHRLGLWSLGVLVGQMTLMALDAWILGDVLFSVRPETVAAWRETNLDSVAQSARTSVGWMNVVWEAQPRMQPIHYSLRHLGILVLLAAAAAGWRRKPLEVRLLHLMPAVYLLLLVALQVRGPHILTSRYLLPILPVSCVLGASLFLYLGIENLDWKELLAPRFWVPVALAAAALFVVFVPWRLGTLEPREFLPILWLDQLAWTGVHFLTSTIVPASLLVFLAALVWWFPRRQARLSVALVGLLALFGVGSGLTWLSLERNLSAQVGEQTLYPWRAFREMLNDEHFSAIVVSPTLAHKRHMGGQAATRDRIARLSTRRPDTRVFVSSVIDARVEVAVGSPADLERWSRYVPGLTETAVFDSTGQVVLVRPRQATPAAGP